MNLLASSLVDPTIFFMAIFDRVEVRSLEPRQSIQPGDMISKLPLSSQQNLDLVRMVLVFFLFGLVLNT